MKLYPFVLVTGILLGGCRGVNRLIEGAPSETVPSPPLHTDISPISNEIPEFKVSVPPSYVRTAFHGALPADATVAVKPASNCLLYVFMRNRIVGQWMILGTTYSGGAYYAFDAKTGIVTYKGNQLELIEFCVYQYLPN